MRQMNFKTRPGNSQMVLNALLRTEEKTTIPWIGYQEHVKYHSITLEEQGYNVERFETAEEGIAALKSKNYPLIILQDWFESLGKFDLPNSIDVDRPTGITCYFLRQVRKMPAYSKTPIVVPHCLSNQGGDLAEFREAGATLLFDLLQRDPCSKLVEKVNELLGKK